jgi:branched-chain amino acid transport system ATP-binding protein
MESVGLENRGPVIAHTLSHGDKKKLDIGIAMARNPKLLLLDEPTAGLNPEETQMIIDLIKSVAQKEKLTVIFTEHDMHVVFSISDTITVLQQGSIIAEGKPEEVRGNKLVIEAYLGEEFH